MSFALSALLLAAAFGFSGLDASWQSLDRVRLQARADKNERRARQMLAWFETGSRPVLVLGWSANLLAALSLVALMAGARPLDSGVSFCAASVLFAAVYVFASQAVARLLFSRCPYRLLSRWWWLVVTSASLLAAPARIVDRLLRRLPAKPLPATPVASELLSLTENVEGISALEQSMLRSVLDFRRLTAGDLALPISAFACVAADRPLASILSERPLAEARHTFVTGADGRPLGAMSCGAAALSGALSARAQSFARPLLSFHAALSAWDALTKLRHAPTPVAEVKDRETGTTVGFLTEQTVVARLLGQAV